MYKKAKVHIYKHTYSTFPGVRLSHFSVYVYTYICVSMYTYIQMSMQPQLLLREKNQDFLGGC